jgi:glycosyltransferase involved in cell wall biosynthesis
MTDETSIPDVSVVIPCYNAERWVGRAIESVLTQEGVTVEVIVIDDGSTDNSVDVLRAYGERIHWETGPNRGACAARNRGLELARAEYVMFLDADDYVEGQFLPAAVEKMREWIADIAFGCIETEAQGQRTLFCLHADENATSVMRAFLTQGFVPPCGTFWSKEFIYKIGAWKEGLRRYQDYELTFRALSMSPRVVFFTSGRGIYFQHATDGRISAKTDIETVRDQVETIRFVARCLDHSDLSEREKSEFIRRRSYRLWQQTCRAGDTHCMREAQQLYREFGGVGHIGSVIHKLVATLIGLRFKEKLALSLAQYRQRFGTTRT